MTRRPWSAPGRGAYTGHEYEPTPPDEDSRSWAAAGSGRRSAKGDAGRPRRGSTDVSGGGFGRGRSCVLGPGGSVPPAQARFSGIPASRREFPVVRVVRVHGHLLVNSPEPNRGPLTAPAQSDNRYQRHAVTRAPTTRRSRHHLGSS